MENGLHPGDDAARQISASKPWHDFLANDVGGTKVRQGTFQTIAHFDAYFSLTQGDKQQHAVLGSLLAELPGGRDAMGEGFERFVFE
jgi:hypothetical protein